MSGLPVSEAGGGEVATSSGPIGSSDVQVSSTFETRTLNPENFLYTEVARSHLGERAATLTGMLLNKGRMSAQELSHAIPKLSTKSIKTILVSLIQLRCVQYVEETAISGRKTTYYYFCEEGFQLMLYAGDIVETVSSYFAGEHDRDITAQIVQNVLALGSLTTKDYKQSIVFGSTSASEVQGLFLKLVESGFLVPLSSVHYTPIVDLWSLLYKKEYNAIPKTSILSDAKKRADAKVKAKQEFNRLVKTVDLTGVITTDMRTSMRQIKDSVPLTFNLGRYMKYRRSRQLLHLSKSRLGKYPSLVYRTALKLTEQSAPPLIDPLCKTGLLQELDEKESIFEDMVLDEDRLPGVTFSAIDIAKHLPTDVDLRGTLISRQKSKKRANKQAQSQKRIKTENGFVPPSPLPTVLEEEQDDEDALADANDSDMDMDIEDSHSDPKSLSLITGHLKLLSNCSIPFLIESKPGLYFVPYTKIIPMLKNAVYDTIIASTLGPSAHRILRCIRDNSLVSEKVINNAALMKEKDIRSVIATLVKYNAIEIQEVPRTTDRAASRAVFLFKSNEQHAYDFMKQNLAWNIANSIHKTEMLKECNTTLLTKAQRDDVKGREVELLLPSELNQLKMVNERELNGHARRTRLLTLWEVFKLF
ncbi:DNA-directed RNA polymerase III subunit C82 Ecym_2821 [Eremothecium cymbalariae DBVPG|uniref:DNA-directed RNA polymerase III subunit RPC3 n=1 Tax=Eremothecium cymbalariae (strain CBS 270.75 / DBVPG 7215 / KCTC 17166 / NRRL Y-17582) TaxID=931890 RepID=G8JQF4_ERECY|nr:Hypothetical protein Ecym_2821 [Eremothecium cymbalariae DBVPG\